MTQRSARHGSFTLDRKLDAPPSRVFHAFADPAAKARWFGGPPGKWKQIVREADFRVGGQERVSGLWEGGVTSAFDCRYHDIVPDQRIVYAYSMHVNDALISVSLATIEFEPAGKGTRLKLTEQGVFLDAFDDKGSREHGTRGLLDRLEESLRD